jgi:5-deoxy-glucuronate isomerase
MPKSDLLIRPGEPDATGRVHSVTPQSAGWVYVGFDTYSLADGDTVALDTDDRENCLVILNGRATVRASDQVFESIGERTSVFDGPPWSVYVPARAHWRLTAQGPCEFAVCSAPARGDRPVRLIAPSEVGQETRGKGSNTRYVRNILPDTSDAAERLLVVEVITPAGNWSSYPPHRHDRDALPDESQLEETYYHRLNPSQGYAVQRVYTDDRTIDETVSVSDGDVVLVPRGYHPVGAAHGYELYYLNVMAGPKRIWRFHNDPAHAWLLR